MAGVNLLEECKPPAATPIAASWNGTRLTLAWPISQTDFVLQQTDSLWEPEWSPVIEPPAEVDGNYVLEVTPEGTTRFYRLTR